MSAWDPSDDELGAIINEVANWPADEGGAEPDVVLPDAFAQAVFDAAFDFGHLDEKYAVLVDDEALAMRSTDASISTFSFGNDELSARGELGPDDLVIGVVEPPGTATVRVEGLSGVLSAVRSVEADDLGRFELHIAERAIRIVVARGDVFRTSGWIAR